MLAALKIGSMARKMQRAADAQERMVKMKKRAADRAKRTQEKVVRQQKQAAKKIQRAWRRKMARAKRIRRKRIQMAKKMQQRRQDMIRKQQQKAKKAMEEEKRGRERAFSDAKDAASDNKHVNRDIVRNRNTFQQKMQRAREWGRKLLTRTKRDARKDVVDDMKLAQRTNMNMQKKVSRMQSTFQRGVARMRDRLQTIKLDMDDTTPYSRMGPGIGMGGIENFTITIKTNDEEKKVVREDEEAPIAEKKKPVDSSLCAEELAIATIAMEFMLMQMPHIEWFNMNAYKIRAMYVQIGTVHDVSTVVTVFRNEEGGDVVVQGKFQQTMVLSKVASLKEFSADLAGQSPPFVHVSDASVSKKISEIASIMMYALNKLGWKAID